MNFGAIVRRLRKQQGLSQEALAKKARIHRIYLVELETGKKTNPGLDVMRRLAKALDVSMSELLKER